jgi:hypothetical protein
MPTRKKAQPAHLLAHSFKKGESGNPNGRPVGSGKLAKRLSLAMVVLSRMECPDNWLVDGLETYKGQKLTVEEAEALRVHYCLTTNQPYKNAALLHESLDRSEGKLASKYVHKSKDDITDDEFTTLSDDELMERIKEMTERAQETQKQLVGENAAETG